MASTRASAVALVLLAVSPARAQPAEPDPYAPHAAAYRASMDVVSGAGRAGPAEHAAAAEAALFTFRVGEALDQTEAALAAGPRLDALRVRAAVHLLLGDDADARAALDAAAAIDRDDPRLAALRADLEAFEAVTRAGVPATDPPAVVVERALTLARDGQRSLELVELLARPLIGNARSRFNREKLAWWLRSRLPAPPDWWPPLRVVTDGSRATVGLDVVGSLAMPDHRDLTPAMIADEYDARLSAIISFATVRRRFPVEVELVREDGRWRIANARVDLSMPWYLAVPEAPRHVRDLAAVAGSFRPRREPPARWYQRRWLRRIAISAAASIAIGLVVLVVARMRRRPA